MCYCCGKAYVANGFDEPTLVEIEVKAHKRVIRRPRWRRACGCASSPIEVSAPPAPRLFPRALYGTSFWARFLFEHCACFRHLHWVAAWMSGQGLPVSPGTLANSLKRFVPLFEPVAEAILAHQNEAVLRHADETGWRVQELRGKTGRAARGCGPRSAATRSPSISMLRAARRRRLSCSAKLSSTQRWRVPITHCIKVGFLPFLFAP